MQEIARLVESETGMDSPRADSELDLGISDFSTPELLQVAIVVVRVLVTIALPSSYVLLENCCLESKCFLS